MKVLAEGGAMLSASGRIISGNARFVRPCFVYPTLQRYVAGGVSDRPQFDPINARKTFKETHNHSTMFKIEKYFSAAMVPLLPAAYFIHGPAMDTALAIAITLHVHWGLHGVLSDYGRPYVIGPTMAKIVQGPLSYILSICLLAGLLHFNSYDVGITKAFEMVWSL
ncbi:CybS [Onchocerca flexuosa]|uniref:Succinate dehydrogenase [ubiquinone] cytochrome b small subunit n=2 Tax=Onchocerca flexuosa TaxID=387005 RepID=A0A238C2X7_9BILA|nr:CybS [Onchocerca flexuosa]